MRERPEQRGGVLEFLRAGLGDAVSDIRSKLIEEGWFGRRSGAPSGGASLASDWTGPTVHGAALPPRQSFEEAWAPRKADQEPSPPGMEIDR